VPSLQRQLRQRPAGAELGCLSERLVIPSERSESRNRGCVPLFTPGKPDRGQGLERLAEDGNPGVLADYISAKMKSVVHSGIVTVIRRFSEVVRVSVMPTAATASAR